MATLTAPRKPRRESHTTGTARLTLTLTVNGQPTYYTVRPVRLFGARRAFRLRKVGKATGQALEPCYVVSEGLDGRIRCDCQDGLYGPPGHVCKHGRALKELGLIG